MTTTGLSVKSFLDDEQGRRFADVVNDDRLDFAVLVDFFNDSARQVRMEDAERHHDRPALAGVVREFEYTEPFKSFFPNWDGHTTRRVRQAVGVIVRMVMEARDWHKTGRKGSLGQRARVPARTVEPGAYHNTSGLSWWFTRAERYERADRPPYPAVRPELPPEMRPDVTHRSATRGMPKEASK